MSYIEIKKIEIDPPVMSVAEFANDKGITQSWVNNLIKKNLLDYSFVLNGGGKGLKVVVLNGKADAIKRAVK
jgi:hypothetical protein